MIKKFFGLAIAGAVLALSSCAVKNEKTQEWQRLISVNGTGSVSVQSDLATINMAVVTYSRSVIDAASRNAEAVAKVRTALVDAGFTADSITTSDYRITQDVSRNNGAQYRGDYRVANSIHIEVRDVSKAGDAIDAAVKAGANEFYSIDFSAIDVETAVREARTQAVKNAYEAANLMAKTAGAELGRVLNINEQSYGAPVMPRSVNSLYKTADTATSITAGDKEISVTVSVTYELK